MSRATVQALKDGKKDSVVQDLGECLRTLRHIATRLNLDGDNDFLTKAEEYCKLTINKKFGKDFSVNAFSAACIYFTCRQQGEPRTFKEICAESKSSRRQLGHCYKAMSKYLESNPREPAAEGQDSSGMFIHRFCTEMGLSEEILLAAKSIFKRSVELDLVPGRSPMSVIGAAIYLASQASMNKKSHQMVAKVSGISPMSIRASYKQMFPRAEELFPPGFNFYTSVDELPLS
ncbi:unnamed protein product [Allacma fusca]|uniref:Transcription initiation factor IIB n=1 Tax=Allacma fusca TaxID=39272 RepID=A0A8J2NGK4_9HEXA|nr:unnamed protein product [Allacma fusca]